MENIEKLIVLGEKEEILILPGIGFCSDWGGSEPIHFIGIFDNQNIQFTWIKLKENLN